jgi:hypothetical protein
MTKEEFAYFTKQNFRIINGSTKTGCLLPNKNENNSFPVKRKAVLKR